MKYLLHIDTATDTGIVAITGDGTVLASRNNDESRNHAATLNNMISDLLAGLKITFKHLDGIAVCAGPGSYTGLRIGMATAKGLCYALDRPLLPDNRLTLLALQAYKKYQQRFAYYVPLLAAREKEYFIAVYDNRFEPVLIPQHITEDQLSSLSEKDGSICFITNVPEQAFENIGINNYCIERGIQTNLNSWGVHAFEKYICNSIVNLSEAEPFYLKQVYTHK